jgi:hypothetical protein
MEMDFILPAWKEFNPAKIAGKRCCCKKTPVIFPERTFSFHF